MTAETKRNTKPVQVGNDHHEAMDRFFKEKRIPKRFQVEIALEAFFKKEAPEIFKSLVKKKS